MTVGPFVVEESDLVLGMFTLERHLLTLGKSGAVWHNKSEC